MDKPNKALEVYKKAKQKEIARELLEKKSNGEELTTDERFILIEELLDDVINNINLNIIPRVYDLEENRLSGNTEKSKSVCTKGIYTINEMYFVQEYEYKNKKFASFMVKVDGDGTLYTWDRVVPIKKPISAGDVIYCEIENDKLRNVKQLQNI